MKRSTYHLRRLEPANWKLIEFTRAAVALGISPEWLCKDHSNDHKKRGKSMIVAEDLTPEERGKLLDELLKAAYGDSEVRYSEREANNERT